MKSYKEARVRAESDGENLFYYVERRENQNSDWNVFEKTLAQIIEVPGVPGVADGVIDLVPDRIIEAMLVLTNWGYAFQNKIYRN